MRDDVASTHETILGIKVNRLLVAKYGVVAAIAVSFLPGGPIGEAVSYALPAIIAGLLFLVGRHRKVVTVLAALAVWGLLGALVSRHFLWINYSVALLTYSSAIYFAARLPEPRRLLEIFIVAMTILTGVEALIGITQFVTQIDIRFQDLADGDIVVGTTGTNAHLFALKMATGAAIAFSGAQLFPQWKRWFIAAAAVSLFTFTLASALHQVVVLEVALAGMIVLLLIQRRLNLRMFGVGVMTGALVYALLLLLQPGNIWYIMQNLGHGVRTTTTITSSIQVTTESPADVAPERAAPSSGTDKQTAGAPAVREATAGGPASGEVGTEADTAKEVPGARAGGQVALGQTDIATVASAEPAVQQVPAGETQTIVSADSDRPVTTVRVTVPLDGSVRARKIRAYAASLIELPRYAPGAPWIGAGLGHFNSRAALFLSGEYLWNQAFVPVSLTDATRELIIPLWNRKLVSQKYQDGVMNQPWSSIMALYSELGIFAILALGFLCVRRIWFLSKEGAGPEIAACFVLIFFIGAAFFDNYLEYPKAVGPLYLFWRLVFDSKAAPTAGE